MKLCLSIVLLYLALGFYLSSAFVLPTCYVLLSTGFHQ